MNHRSRVVALSIGVVMFAVACTVPARDNPNDPANAPHATLTITPAAGSIHQVFHFAVSGSSDTIVSAALDLDGDGTFETPMNMQTKSFDADAEIPVQADAFGPTGEGWFYRTVAAELTSKSGTAEVSAQVGIHNSAPTVDLGADVIAAAWEQPTVHLNACGDVLGCAAPDPDGPAGLSYTWTQVLGTAVIPGVVHTSALSFSAPLAPQTLVFDLTVSDGFASVTEPQIVHVGRPAWISSSNPRTLDRFFPDSVRTDVPSLPLPRAIATAVDGSVWTVNGVVDSTGWTVQRILPDGAIAGRWQIPIASDGVGSVGDLVGSSDGGGWAIFAGTSTQPGSTLYRLEPIVSGTSGAVAAVANVPLSRILQILPDKTTGGIFALDEDTKAARIRPDLSVSAALPIDNRFVNGNVVANDGTLWTAFNDNLGLHVHHLVNDVDEPLDVPSASSFYALLPGSEGVMLLLGDGATLEQVLPIVDTTAPLLPELPVPAVATFNGRFLANGDGDFYVYDSAENTVRRLHGTETGFELAASTDLDGLGVPATDAASYNDIAIAPDVWNGGVFVAELDLGGSWTETGWVRVSASGLPFGPALGVLPYMLATETGRGSYWTETTLFDGEHLRRYDVRGTLLGDHLIPYSDSAGLNVFADGPDGGAFYAAQTTSGHVYLRQVSRTGTLLSSPVDIVEPARPGILAFGLDGSGAPACVATVNSNYVFQTPHAQLFRTAGGTPVQFASAPTLGGLPEIASSRSGACWGALPDDTSVEFANASGTATFPVPSGSRVDAVVADPYDDSVWVVDEAGPPANVFHLSSAGGTLGQFTLPAPFGTSAVGFRQAFVTRDCDPGVPTTAARPECRNFWFYDGASPATVYRLDGTGKVMASFTLPAGGVGWLDVR